MKHTCCAGYQYHSMSGVQNDRLDDHGVMLLAGTIALSVCASTAFPGV